MASYDELNVLIVQIFKLHGLLMELGNNLTRQYGQTSARWQVLGVIDERPLSVPQVAEIMGLTRQGVQKTADLLVSEGLIEFIENPEHKKSQLLAVTRKGLNILRKIEASQKSWAKLILKEMDTEKLTPAVKFLDALTAVLKSSLQSEEDT